MTNHTLKSSSGKGLTGLLMLMWLLSTSHLQAQELPEVIPPSPTVANLMTFEEVPIDFHTGQPNISIPIYAKQISAQAGLNIALRYNTQGVKVDSRSSWVGTGWSLDLGGVISRTVRGIPDDKQLGTDNTLGLLHNAEFWDYDNLGNFQVNTSNGTFTASKQEEFKWRAKGSSSHRYDTQFDLYQYSLLGASGRFVVVKEGGELVAKQLNLEGQVKIELDPDPVSLQINSFTVTDAYGYKYFFDKKEVTRSTPLSDVQVQRPGSEATVSSAQAAGVYNHISAWHLKTITTSNGKRLARFDYEMLTEEYTVSRTSTENQITNISAPVQINDFIVNDYNNGILKPRRTVSYFSIEVDALKPKKVTFNDSTSVNFEAKAAVHPETNGPILESVIVKDKAGNEKLRFTLDTEETFSNERLWLTGLRQSAGALELEHKFNYYQKQNLPAFASVSDIWGYFTGDSGSILPQNFDHNTIRTGLLSSIDYPTGGRKVFEFENHTFSYGSGQTFTADQLWNNPDNYTLNRIDINFSGPEDLSSNSGAFGTTLLPIDFEQRVFFEVDLTATETANSTSDPFLSGPQGSGIFDPVNSMLIRIKDPSQNVIAVIPLKNNAFITTADLPAGTHTMEIMAPELGTWDMNGHIKIHRKLAKPSIVSRFWYGGGARIKSISFLEDTTDANSVERKWNYDYADPTDATKSSGALDALLGNLRREYDVTVNKYLFRGRDNNSVFEPMQITYRVLSQGANAQITKGGYVGYKTVAVSETGNGKTVYTYTNAVDFSSPPETFDYPFPAPPNIDHKRGLLTNQSVFDEDGRILSEVINEYDYLQIEETVATSLNLVDPETCEWNQFYDQFQFFVGEVGQNVPLCGGSALPTPCLTQIQMNNCSQFSGLYFDEEAIISGWAPLIEKTQKEYFYNTASPTVVESRETYEYNLFNYLTKKVNRFVEEKGSTQLYETKLFYPVGDEIPTGLYTQAELDVIRVRMAAIHDINTVVLTQNFKNKVPISTVQNVFGEFLTDQIKPVRVKTAKGSNPLETRLEFHDYDKTGNILELSKADDVHIAYIWGYGNTIPVAQISNATYTQIKNLNGFGTPFTGTDLALTTAQENSLRSLPNTQVVTMTYDPVFGMVSQTDPNNKTNHFVYDAFGRLKLLKDFEQNIVSKNIYHYKGQQN